MHNVEINWLRLDACYGFMCLGISRGLDTITRRKIWRGIRVLCIELNAEPFIAFTRSLLPPTQKLNLFRPEGGFQPPDPIPGQRLMSR